MRRIIVIAALAMLLILALAVRVARDCDIEKDWRAEGDIVLLCVGRDPVRLWPLPPVMPYWEDADWMKVTEQGL